MTHPRGPIMMKWLIWVILEGLQGLLLATTSFFNKLFPFFTTRLLVRNTNVSTRTVHGARIGATVAVPVQASARMPKAFDTTSMEQFEPIAWTMSLDCPQG